MRRRSGLTQKEIADGLGISASYLNLIEHNRRPLPASLLIKLARTLRVDLSAFADDDDEKALHDLVECLADPVFEDDAPTALEAREFLQDAPHLVRALLVLYARYRDARESAQALVVEVSEAQEMTGVDRSRLPSEEVSDLLQRHRNYFPELEERAERLWQDAHLETNDMYAWLVRYLENAHLVTVKIETMSQMAGAMRRFDKARRVLSLCEVLAPRSRNFQLAHQIGLLCASDAMDRIADESPLSAPESKALARVALASYFAGAVLMPYRPFLEAATSERFDIELLGHRFRTSFEQVCHRLTTLQRPGAEGVPFHFLRVDIAGNISKRFSNSGIRFARFSGVCPRWNVFAAFLTPGLIRTQVSRMPDGTTYFCVARTEAKGRGRFHQPHTMHAIAIGCDVKHAKKLIYADGMDLEHLDTAVPVGVTCRLCERLDCEQRAVPPMQHPIHVDENVRGLSFYAPVASREERRSSERGDS